MKKIFPIILSVLIIFLMGCLILFPDRYISVAANGIKLWALSVVPSLFPFFFLTLLLTKIGVLNALTSKADKLSIKLFRCNGISLYVFFMSVLSGYPIGAKLISELYTNGRIDKQEATRMSTFCSTSGPLFVIGTVGVNMFDNKLYGIAMLLSHLLSAVSCGLIFKKYGKFNQKYISIKNHEGNNNLLYECIYSSVISILCVGGFICIFYLLASILSDLKLLTPITIFFKWIFSKAKDPEILAKGISFGLIECTNGCKILSSSPSILSACSACAVISFGGLSVAFQSIIYLSKAKVNLKIFFLSKFLQMLISFALCLLILQLINIF